MVDVVQRAEPSVRLDESEERTSLYDQDERLWLLYQIKTLQSDDHTDLDIKHLIAELQNIVDQNEKAVRALLCVTVNHLRWIEEFDKHDPQVVAQNANHWRAEIDNFRSQIVDAFDVSPSLKSQVEPFCDRAWERSSGNVLKKVYEPSARSHGALQQKLAELEESPQYAVNEILGFNLEQHRQHVFIYTKHTIAHGEMYPEHVVKVLTKHLPELAYRFTSEGLVREGGRRSSRSDRSR